ncbi:hypothetical protein [Spirulina sp. 06S082]|uniref:hypothetical protein n=1 Tax=Spirulina sp. 06S082 TaxID=3110248 RepID=UPI002B1FE455|nr:hypothetical protein [Spirulina sp. 06S082]MEA5470800.1 hypothetical protein [Spirulina sp. 06S082]
MIKHYILSLEPNAKHPWDRCVLRDPITGERPELLEAIAEGTENQAGSYLIAVNLEVTVLEKASAALLKKSSEGAIASFPTLKSEAVKAS